MMEEMNTEGFDWYYGRLKDKCKSAKDKSWLSYVNRWGCALQQIEGWYTEGEKYSKIDSQMKTKGFQVSPVTMELWKETSHTYKNPMNWWMVLEIGKALDPENKHHYQTALIAVILAWNSGFKIIDSYKEDLDRLRQIMTTPRQAYNYRTRTSGDWNAWLATDNAEIAKLSIADDSPFVKDKIDGKRKTKPALFPWSVRAFKRWGCERLVE